MKRHRAGLLTQSQPHEILGKWRHEKIPTRKVGVTASDRVRDRDVIQMAD